MDRREAKRVIKRTYKLADGNSNDAEIAGLQDARDLLEQWRRELKDIQLEARLLAMALESNWEDGDLAGSVTDAVAFLRQLAENQPADTASSGSRQHYIDTGRYLTEAEVAEHEALQMVGTPLLLSKKDGVVTVTELTDAGDEW